MVKFLRTTEYASGKILLAYYSLSLVLSLHDKNIFDCNGCCLSLTRLVSKM